MFPSGRDDWWDVCALRQDRERQCVSINTNTALTCLRRWRTNSVRVVVNVIEDLTFPKAERQKAAKWGKNEKLKGVVGPAGAKMHPRIFISAWLKTSSKSLFPPWLPASVLLVVAKQANTKKGILVAACCHAEMRYPSPFILYILFSLCKPLCFA